jgi:hypothetical protein
MLWMCLEGWGGERGCRHLEGVEAKGGGVIEWLMRNVEGHNVLGFAGCNRKQQLPSLDCKFQHGLAQA